MRAAMRLQYEHHLNEVVRDKRVPVEAFPSFQEQELYAILAHSLSLVSEKEHSTTYRAVQVCGAWARGEWLF